MPPELPGEREPDEPGDLPTSLSSSLDAARLR